MHFGTKATLIAATVFPAAVLPVMLMDTAAAVEVSDSSTPPLPVPSYAAAGTPETTRATAPPSQDCFILGSRTFSIPFTVDAVGVRPTEVQLYVCRGAGDGWNLLDRKRPDTTTHEFQFTAQADGEYWFATRTFDQHGRPHPSGNIRPELKVYVDTTKPQVTLDVDADADGEVKATIAIDDATPLKNIQLRYATDTGGQWKDVDLSQMNTGGTFQLQPADDWKQISVQCIVTDTPGNQSVMQQLVKRPRLAANGTHQYAAAATDNEPSGQSRAGGLQIQPAPYRSDYTNRLRAEPVSNPVIQLDRHRNPPPPTPGVSTAYGYAQQSATPLFRGSSPVETPANRGVPTPFAPPPTTVRAFPMSAPASNPFFANQFAQPQTAPATAPQPTTPQVTTPQVEEILPPVGTPDVRPNGIGLNPPDQQNANSVAPPTPRPRTAAEAMRPIDEASAADQHTQREDIPTPAPDGVSRSPELNLPAPQSNSPASTERARANRVDPSINRAEPSGVDLEAAMRRAPRRYSDSFRFSLDYELEAVGNLGVEAIELYGTVDSGKSWQLWGRDPDRASPFDIETKEEGKFGFRIVVVGQNGLASPRPMAGESPDIVVVVDTVAPKVRITGAQYGEGDRIGALVIRYECEDENLQPRPVALSFSDTVEGPWTTIAAGLRNDGDYVWPADPQLPRKLFLRIDVTDQAGNVGTYVLQEPIDAQGLAPRARIRGFQPLSGNVEPNDEDQTARRSWSLFQ